jgi:hypothetical protein
MRVIQKLNILNEWEGKGNHCCEGSYLPAYSPDLIPSDFHLFFSFKETPGQPEVSQK